VYRNLLFTAQGTHKNQTAKITRRMLDIQQSLKTLQ